MVISVLIGEFGNTWDIKIHQLLKTSLRGNAHVLAKDDPVEKKKCALYDIRAVLQMCMYVYLSVWWNSCYPSTEIRQMEMVYGPQNKFGMLVILLSLASLLPSIWSRGKRYT